MKQPRVPEYREADGVKVYIKSLILFLKDFSMSAWTANNQRKKEIEALSKAGGGGSGAIGLFGFHIDENGHLICTYETETPPPLYIDSNGHLIYTYTLGEEADNGADA